jgi:hypothetical protein
MSGTPLSIDNALHGVRELLADRITPAVDDPFAAQMLRLSCLLLKISANAVDDAAELRVAENAAIRAVLGEAAGLVAEPLAGRLRAAAVSADPDLKLTVLDAESDRLRKLLIEAQTVIEVAPDAASRNLDQRIWRLLESIEAKRAPRE